MGEIEIKKTSNANIVHVSKQEQRISEKNSEKSLGLETKNLPVVDMPTFTSSQKTGTNQNNSKVNYNKEQNIITIESNGQKTKIDLNNLLRRVHNDNDKKYITDAILRMHPDALQDLAKEVKTIDCYRDENDGMGGDMVASTNLMRLNPKLHKEKNVDLTGTITHELGHGLDAQTKQKKMTTVTDNSDYIKMFNEEVEQYRKKGFYRIGDVPNMKRGDKSIYATANPSEMYAEIYRLLHTKDINSDPELKILKEHFPRCIEFVKKSILETRKLSDAQRNTSHSAEIEKYSNGKLEELTQKKHDGRFEKYEKYDKNGMAILKQVATYPEDILRNIPSVAPEEVKENMRKEAEKGPFVIVSKYNAQKNDFDFQKIYMKDDESIFKK